jgi:hypothetical protein
MDLNISFVILVKSSKKFVYALLFKNSFVSIIISHSFTISVKDIIKKYKIAE